MAGGHNKIDRIGSHRYRLTVIAAAGSDKFGCAMWLCQCSCGKEVVSNLRFAKSCGCLRKENLARGNRTHGMHDAPEYSTWTNMRNRCNNKRAKKYHLYGGRGIKICRRWDSFPNFMADMGPKPFPGASIERVNNDLGYAPENCRWATNTEQSRNRRSNRFLSFNGKKMCLEEWATHLGFKSRTLQQRLAKGWSVRKTLTTPLRVWS